MKRLLTVLAVMVTLSVGCSKDSTKPGCDNPCERCNDVDGIEQRMDCLRHCGCD
jgi:hypothetical protein